MKRLSGRRAVTRAIKTANAAVSSALKQTNQQAGKLLAKGDYTGAEALVSTARAIGAFQTELKALSLKWQGLGGPGARKVPRGDRAPLWEFYRPVLQALMALGGEARLPAIHRQLESSAASLFKPGDLATGPSGSPRWKAAVAKTRKHLVAEGWVERKPLTTWRLTEAGRQAAVRAEPAGGT